MCTEKISVIHQNLQSIGNSVNLLVDFLEEQEDCVVLCTTEHWKTREQLPQYDIKGFKLAASFCRVGMNRHGGCAIYVKKGFKCKVRLDLNKLGLENHFECCSCEVIINSNKVVIVSLYRPPDGDIKVFQDKLEKLLKVNDKNNIIICGDLNVDFLLKNKNMLDILSIANSFDVHHTINEATRITESSQTCIDNILTNFKRNFISNVLHSHISDHTAQKITLKFNKELDQHIYKRNFSKNNIFIFEKKLSEVGWKKIYSFDNPFVNDQWNEFMKIILLHFNDCFPIKKVPINNIKKLKKEKKNPEVRECKEQLDKLYVLKNLHISYKPLYIEKKKEYDSLLLKCKKNEFSERLRTSDNKTKSAWAIVNEISGKSKNNDISIEGDPETVANQFNAYWLDSVSKISANLGNIPFNSFIDRNPECISIESVSASEILEVTNKLKNKFSSGHDEMSTSLLKKIVHVIVKPLVHIINNSLRFGVFPDQLKLAVVVPVFKKGEITHINNYRPISLLPSFSKIFEHVMRRRIMVFMTESKLLNESQHGFIMGRSTHTAIFQFVDHIIGFLEDGNIPLGLFLDLSKAYDTLNHDILIKKLELYGIRGAALRWMVSYLSGRYQQIAIGKGNNRAWSKKSEIKIGIPQGSVIGPLLFIIYTNNISEIQLKQRGSTITSYADDTNLLVNASTITTAIYKANSLMMEADNWFSKNKLVLNSSKTSIMLFKPSRGRREEPQKIKIIDQEFDLDNSTKFLGVVLDNTLCWDEHVEYMEKRLNSVCYSFRVLCKYLDVKTRIMLYHANFVSHIRYGIIFYGGCSNLNRILICQKRTLRTILGVVNRETCRGKFKANKILTVYAMYVQECLLFFYKNRHLFRNSQSQTIYPTRSQNYLYPRHRLALTEKGAYYNCIRFYNSLPTQIQLIDNLKKFKKRIFQMLIDIEPYNLEEYFIGVC